MDLNHSGYSELRDEINRQMEDIVSNYTRFEQRAIRKNHREGLTATETHILDKVGRDGGRSMGEVAESLSITTGTLTVSVNRLVKKGFLERKTDKKDRRVVLLYLTRRGHAAYRLHRRFHNRMVENLMEALGVHECGVFASALKTLNHFLLEGSS